VNLLLDTHAFRWWLRDDSSLGGKARAAIAKTDNLVFVSAASAWEIATKRARGKLPGLPPTGNVEDWIERTGSIPLPIGIEHAVAAAELPSHHRDPFDRLLVAQARVEDLTLVTGDAQIAKYRVKLLDAAT
jgi:PIN domain nuclease of toxin-antitoxin system